MMPVRRLLLAALFTLFCAQAAQAKITFSIGEPAEGSVKSGVGLISGWAISDRGVVSVEALIDGVSLGPMPYGGQRGDVAAAYPGVPGSMNSGWGMKWAYPLLADGEHELTIVVTEEGGATASRSVTFEVVGFHSEFISDPASVQTVGATVSSPEDGRLVVSGAQVEGETVDIELAWDTASQQFLVDTIHYPDQPKTNQAPSADAGLDFTLESGQAASISGSGSDPDGAIAGWRWSRTGGLAVALVGATSRTVRFTAPTGPGEIHLRLTVTDDGGATASDDVTVTVLAPPAPNQAPSANAGPDVTVAAGSTVRLTGNGSDPDGTVTTWSWTQVEGPAVALSGAATREVTFTAPGEAATLRLRLTVTDNDGASAADDVVVTVEAPPAGGSTSGSKLPSMLAWINEARAVARDCGGTPYAAQPALQWSESLAEIAMVHSMDMAQNAYFDHTSLDGTSMGERVFPYWTGTRVGENIAASSHDRSDEYVVQMWLDSPGHCALIMDPDFTHAGIGVGSDPENGWDYHYFWTIDFGG